MSELEKMERYISRTKIKMKNRDLYTMRISEMAALHDAPCLGMYKIICMAFDYGMAKGYRMAKKEARA